MHSIVQKTLGGLSKAYYFRQLIFGLVMFGLVLYLTMGQGEGSPFSFIPFLTISTLLYPYSRFVYESIVDFIIGDNIFIGNAIVMLITKFITMFLCWGFAIFIAPIGLLYLYFYHSRQEREEQSET
ncbi:MAG: hypothetical protein FWG52_01740 [Proteobacteria bacterium]|nr:hypothetical protein [Pseudomonadota bacterium]